MTVTGLNIHQRSLPVGNVMKHTFQNRDNAEYARLVQKLELPDKKQFKELFQFSQLSYVGYNDQCGFRFKRLLRIDIYVNAFSFFDSNDVETVFFTEI